MDFEYLITHDPGPSYVAEAFSGSSKYNTTSTMRNARTAMSLWNCHSAHLRSSKSWASVKQSIFRKSKQSLRRLGRSNCYASRLSSAWQDFHSTLLESASVSVMECSRDVKPAQMYENSGRKVQLWGQPKQVSTTINCLTDIPPGCITNSQWKDVFALTEFSTWPVKILVLNVSTFNINIFRWNG